MGYIIGAIVGVSFSGLVVFLLKNWIVERLKTSLQKEHSKFLEELKYDIKIREQAIKVADYLAHARQLDESDDKDRFAKLNQLSWELAIWLPEDIYNSMVQSIVMPNDSVNALTTVIAVRKLLLKDNAGELTSDDIASHAPGIGKKKD